MRIPLRLALWERDRTQHPVVPGELTHHSDAGSQYTAVKFTENLALQGITPSIGSVGDAYDNALMESINGLYKTECIGSRIFTRSAWSRSWTWSWRPCRGCSGTTPVDCTPPSGWSHPRSTRRPTGPGTLQSPSHLRGWLSQSNGGNKTVTVQFGRDPFGPKTTMFSSEDRLDPGTEEGVRDESFSPG